LLTELGFALVGPTVFAFLVGEVVVLAVILAASTVVALRRLPLPAALVFILYVSLLVVMPSNVGDSPTAYSFAMAYNRFSWSALAVLLLAVFLPPRFGARGARGDFGDAAIALALLIALYYLKITDFAAGLGGLALALAISAHV